MTTAPAVQPVLPFAEFLEELRRQGFVIGLDQHLRLQLLLDQLADSCPPERLKTHLCPIFATSPEEQGRFHRAFDRFYPAFATAGEESEREARRSAATESLMPERRGPDGLRRRVLLVLAIAATLAGLGFWWWSARKGEPPPAPAAIDSAAVTPPPIASDTAVAPAPAAADSVAPLPTPAPESEPGRGTFFARHRTAIRYLAVVLPFLLFLFNEWRLYRRRRLVVERQRRQKPPFSWPVRLEAPVNPFTDSEELPTAARHLRQREAGEVERLSVEQSVSATIAALGFPTFRYKTDTRMPEYLLLIEREAHRDHRARLFQSLAHALEKEGVHTTRYFYDGDPRVCDPEDGQHHELLVDIRRRFPGYRLLVFGTGARLVDPLSGRLQPWTTDFLSWSDRALLTPESPSTWGVRELALAQHFVVLPATTQGLLGVVDHFRGPVRPDPRRWQEDDPGPDTPRLDDGDPLPRLRSFLGPKVFRWLCACAVYPELHWDLTLHLGSLPELGPGLITEEHLLRLLRLPWYRQGAIPDEARAQLIDQLTEAEERAVRQAIVELLERNPAPGDSVSANRYELNLVVQRLALGRRDPKQRAEALKELRGFPRRELVQDFAMVRLLEETPSSRLAVILPRRFRRVFYRDGVPAFGIRAGARVGVLAGLIGAGLVMTRTEEPEWNRELILAWPGSPPERLVVGEQIDEMPMRLVHNPNLNVEIGEIWPAYETQWSVDRPEIVSVEGNGRITALRPGKAEVTVVAGGRRARLKVEVFPTEFAIDRDTLTLRPGDVRAIKLIVPSLERRELAPRTAGTMEWSVDDPKVIRMAPRGVIEALAAGRARVTVRGLGKEASIAIGVTGGGAADPVVEHSRAAQEISRSLDALVEALNARSTAQLRQAYPGMSSVEEAQWRSMLEAKILKRLVASLVPSGDPRIDRDTAESQFRLRLQLTYVARPVSNLQVDYHALFRRDSERWQLVRLLQQPVTGEVVTGESARFLVEQVVREYARAQEASDLKAMLAVYPTMPAPMRTGYEGLFATHRSIKTGGWEYLSISVEDTAANVQLGGTSVIRDSAGRPYATQAFPRTVVLHKSGDGWRITRINIAGARNVPTEALSYYARGLLYQDRGDTAQAREYFGKALMVFPEFSEAITALLKLSPVGDSSAGPAVAVVSTRRPGANLEDLQRLDSLRALAARRSGPARIEYFRLFDSLLFRPTQAAIVERLRALPAGPNADADYVWSYSLLQAHLMTSAYPEKSTPEFLAPVLTRVWNESAQTSGYMSRLVQAQFTFFAEQLARGPSPQLDITDSSAVRNARAFLQQFKNGEQIYHIMQSEATKARAKAFDFARIYPNANQVLTASHVVPPAFTRQGWRYMQDSAFKMPERYFQGEEWVLGQRPSERERYTIVDSIRNRYRRDYADHWRRVLAEARVAPFANLTDAARKLKVLGSNTSPLMQLINAVSLNTAVDPALASTIFQPALAVSPPDSTRLIAVQTRPYMGALQGLGAALEALEAAGPAEREGQAQDAKEQVAAAKNTARAIEALFARVPNGVGPDITRLLQAGFSSIEDMLGQAGPAVIDQPREAVVASVALTTPVTSLAIGETTTWIAVPRDAGGKELADRAVVWRSSAPLVATVSGDGHVTALTAGTAEITVEVEGISASQRVIVTPAAPAPPRVSGPGAEAQSSYNRALQFEDQNLLAKASDAYREALRAFPEYAEASAGLTRVVVRLRVFDWAKHLERRSLTGLRQMYPDMPAKDQQAWKRLLENPSLTRISVEPRDLAVELTGPEARVRYALVYTMMMRPNGLQTSVNRYAATFKLLRGAWLITAMQGVP